MIKTKKTKLPRSKKAARVAIAQDVLTRLHIMNTGQGSYCGMSSDYRYYDNPFPDDVSVRDNFEEIIPNCSVCARELCFWPILIYSIS